jgi:hypothetical protein
MKSRDYLILGIAVGLVAAAVYHFLLEEEVDEKPPKRAPQVPIHNPGEQSDFTTAASESEIG